MPGILSTKKLTRSQQELLLNAGCSLVEQELISIVPLPFETKELPENIIFTSKNAVKVVLNKNIDLRDKKIFCVGSKTAEFLREKNLYVQENADYGLDLAKKIVSDHPGKTFLFFCGRTRRDELPDYLRQRGVSLTEVEVYDTQLIQKKLDRIFDGVMFFSPSAVRSFCSMNDLRDSVAFCIGGTTASEASNYTNNIKVAKKPTVENVIVQVVKHFNDPLLRNTGGIR